jgi:hypothetical protein
MYMSVNPISPSHIQTTEGIKPKTTISTDFAISSPPPVTSTTTGTVSISSEAKAKSVSSVDNDGLTEEMRNAALPPWLAPFYPEVPRVGMSAAEADSLNPGFNKLTVNELSQYYSGIQKYYREALEANNLVGNPNKFYLLNINKDSSEKVRLDFEKRIAADGPLSGLIAKMSK